jgi:hypothetical protein
MAKFIKLLGIPNHVYQITGRHKKNKRSLMQTKSRVVIHTGTLVNWDSYSR